MTGVVKSAQSEMTKFGQSRARADDPPCAGREWNRFELLRTVEFAAPRDEAEMKALELADHGGFQTGACGLLRRIGVGRSESKKMVKLTNVNGSAVSAEGEAKVELVRGSSSAA